MYYVHVHVVPACTNKFRSEPGIEIDSRTVDTAVPGHIRISNQSGVTAVRLNLAPPAVYSYTVF